MVLSNKKLKQTLRAAKAELITASGAENNFSNKKYEKSMDFDSKASDSLRTILNLEAQRSRSKRAKPKRVKQSPTAPTENADVIKNGDITGVVEHKIQDGLNSDTMQVEKNKKKEKRKRDESEASEKLNKVRKNKKKKKNKRPRQWWLEKKKNKDDNKTEEVEDGAAKEEGVNRNESGSTGDQFVAKAIETNNRENLEISQKVYVGGIPYYSTEDDIRSYFESCGTITSIDCMTFPDTGKFRGIAIITFKTDAAAKRALALDGSDMGGLFLKVQPFKSARVNKLPNFTPPVPEGYNRIYVGNLSWDITENDLRNILADCTIKSIRFGEDKETGEFKGYAHVDLADNLSLNAALKFDQAVVCGRPVRITCALKNGTASKPKETAANLKATPEDNQVDSGNLKIDFKNSATFENQVISGGEDVLSSKIRRRTCYECGEKGHLSSACPKIAAASKAEAMPIDNQIKNVTSANSKSTRDNYQVESGYYSAPAGNQVTSTGEDVQSSKIRRRTCYECGEKGHLSSACPKIQTMQVDNQVDGGKKVTATNFKAARDDYQVESGNVGSASNGANGLSSKIRRRTCYECGEKGHLSSACPKIATPCKTEGMQIDTEVEAAAVVSSSVAEVSSSKIRRRTCYECGERGHLSSACPKTQASAAAAAPPP